MNSFRLFLAAFLAVLVSYTFVVITNHGADLFSVFIGDMTGLNWAGQFNLDFTGFLMLSGIWTAWRNHFTQTAFALSLLAFFGGMLFLGIYLLYLSYAEQGDVKRMLLGRERARDAGLG
ncbi:MAG: hypothetical protein F4Y89_01585 [Gammaproteobacteria bacterium]|nr:hypothetical protein [Gammaproteobacteria bacterium]MYG97238.1 hypothetical protein [Gammaproteobacteria bacterium]